MLWSWLYHWIYIDLWVPLWPNLAASAVIWLFMWWKLRIIHDMHKIHLQLTRELHGQLVDNSPENELPSEAEVQ